MASPAVSVATREKEETIVIVNDGEFPPPPPTASTLRDTETEKDLSGDSSSDSSDDPDSGSNSESESDSEETSDSDSDSSLDSEFEEVPKERLKALLAKARENLRAKSEKAKGKQKAAFDANDDEIKLVDSEDEAEKERKVAAQPLPDLDPGKSYKTYFNYESQNKGESDNEDEDEDESLRRRKLKKKDVLPPPSLRDIEAEALESEAGPSNVPAAPLPPPELAKDGRKLTKKEIKAQKKKAAGPGWFDLPTPDAADLPRLYREVEALRLRNALDPKRFYRKESGEGKGIKGLPAQFAIGTIVPTSTPFGTASSENLTRAERKRTLVDELVDDSETKRYAKRKFDDFQSSRAARGRGTFAKRFAGRKPKW